MCSHSLLTSEPAVDASAEKAMQPRVASRPLNGLKEELGWMRWVCVRDGLN